MRYQVSAKIEGKAYLNAAVSTRREDLLFEFRVDEQSRLFEVAVSVRAPDDQRAALANSVGPTVMPGVGPHIKLGGDRRLNKRLIAELQRMESMLSFVSYNSVIRVHWENAQCTTVPETEDDKPMARSSSVALESFYETPRVDLTPEYLRELAEDAPTYSALVVPQAFLREGWSHFHRFEYVLAFYKHYFVIEDFYADGKSSKAAVLKAFARSEEFCALCRQVLSQILPLERHGDRLQKLLKDHSCTVDDHGLQELLFLVRGSLHHYRGRSTRRKATPFNQESFETEALMMGTLAASAVMAKVVGINRKHDGDVPVQWNELRG